MPHRRERFPITVAGVTRELPLFEVQPGLRIAVLNILGDTELVRAAAAALADRLADTDYAALVTPETKSIPLAHELATRTGRPYVVLRKAYKPYMGDALATQTQSITSGGEQTLYLDEKDAALIDNQPVVLVDDVISTGSTLQGMRQLMHRAGARVTAEATIATEGERGQWQGVISLVHLPLFRE